MDKYILTHTTHASLGIQEDLDIPGGTHRLVRERVLRVGGLVLMKRVRITNSQHVEDEMYTFCMWTIEVFICTWGNLGI